MSSRGPLSSFSVAALGFVIGLTTLLSGCSNVWSGHSISIVHAGGNEETIVLFRHGENPAQGLGQLDCRGLSRSLALPQVLISRFGAADAAFAPNPSAQITEGTPPAAYSYIRPLATIEPTAVRLGLPVNTQIAFDDPVGLQTAVTNPAYAKSTIFIAWEHGNAHTFAVNMLTAYGLDPSVVPSWKASDYDMIYVFHITPPAGSTGPGQLTFEVEHEGLNNSLDSTCPV